MCDTHLRAGEPASTSVDSTLPCPDWAKLAPIATRGTDLAGMQAVAGLHVEVVASEPLIVNPVWIGFSPENELFVLSWGPPSAEAKTGAPRDAQAIPSAPRTSKDDKDGPASKGPPPARKAGADEHPRLQTEGQGTRQAMECPDFLPPAARLRVLTDADRDGRFKGIRKAFEVGEWPTSLAFAPGAVYIANAASIARRQRPQPNGPWSDASQLVTSRISAGPSLGGLHWGWLPELFGAQGPRSGAEAPDQSHLERLSSGVVFRYGNGGESVRMFARGLGWPTAGFVHDAGFHRFLVDCVTDPASGGGRCRLMHLVEGGDYGWRAETCQGRFPDVDPLRSNLPAALPSLLDLGPGIPTPLCYLSSPRFPEFLQGALIYPDALAGEVRAYWLEPQGATFHVARGCVLMKSTDPAFHPRHVVLGNDGGLYVADFRSPVGPDFPWWGDGRQGRLYRLTWSGTDSAPAIPLPSASSRVEIVRTSDALLLQQLRAADFLTRTAAHTEIIRRGERFRIPLLELLRNTEEPALARRHALVALTHFWDAQARALFQELLSDADADIRRLACDAIAELVRREARDTRDDLTLWGALLQRVIDGEPDPTVGRQLMIAMARLQGDRPESGEIVAEEWVSGTVSDPVYRGGLIHALELTGKSGLRPLFGALQSDIPEKREIALQAWERVHSRVAADMLSLVLRRTDKLDSGQLIRLLATYRNYELDVPLSADPLVLWLEKHPEAQPAERAAALRAVSWLDAVDRDRLEPIVFASFKSDDVDLRRAAISAAARHPITAIGPLLLAALKEAQRGVDERRDLINALAALNVAAAIPFLEEWTQQPHPLRANALSALGVLQPDMARSRARQVLTDRDEAAARVAIDLLAVDAARTSALALQCLEENWPAIMRGAVRQALRRQADAHPELFEALQALETRP